MSQFVKEGPFVRSPLPPFFLWIIGQEDLNSFELLRSLKITFQGKRRKSAHFERLEPERVKYKLKSISNIMVANKTGQGQ